MNHINKLFYLFVFIAIFVFNTNIVFSIDSSPYNFTYGLQLTSSDYFPNHMSCYNTSACIVEYRLSSSPYSQLSFISFDELSSMTIESNFTPTNPDYRRQNQIIGRIQRSAVGGSNNDIFLRTYFYDSTHIRVTAYNIGEYNLSSIADVEVAPVGSDSYVLGIIPINSSSSIIYYVSGTYKNRVYLSEVDYDTYNLSVTSLGYFTSPSEIYADSSTGVAVTKIANKKYMFALNCYSDLKTVLVDVSEGTINTSNFYSIGSNSKIVYKTDIMMLNHNTSIVAYVFDSSTNVYSAQVAVYFDESNITGVGTRKTSNKGLSRSSNYLHRISDNEWYLIYSYFNSVYSIGSSVTSAGVITETKTTMWSPGINYYIPLVLDSNIRNFEPMSYLPISYTVDNDNYNYGAILQWSFIPNFEFNNSLNVSEIYSYSDILHTCTITSSEGNLFNLTMSASNGTTQLYSETFVDVNISETKNKTFTFNNSYAHQTITFNCSLIDSDLNTAENTFSKIIQNTAPTSPNNITITPATLYVGSIMNATSTGSTDADDDEITYYYKFYNVDDLVILQDWSSTKTYTVQTGDENDDIRIYSKAYDGYAYSSDYYIETSISNSTPSTPSTCDFTAPIGDGYKNSTYTASASGSVDPQGLTLTYYYRFESSSGTYVYRDWATSTSFSGCAGDPNCNKNNDISVKCKTQNTVDLDSEVAISDTKDIINSAPSSATSISVLPASAFVLLTLNATAVGVLDADGDSITQYYKFYNINTSTTLQDWSTTKTYYVGSEFENNTFRIYTKAYDGVLYSSETYSDKVILPTKPSIPSTCEIVSGTYKDSTYTASASGSVDPQGLTLTYYYRFESSSGTYVYRDWATSTSYSGCAGDPNCNKNNDITVKCKTKNTVDLESEVATSDTTDIQNKAPSITVTTPDATPDVNRDTSYTIGWTASDVDSDTLSISCYADTDASGYDVSYTFMTASANDGSETTNITSWLQNNYYVWCRANDSITTTTDYSSSYFQVNHAPTSFSANDGGATTVNYPATTYVTLSGSWTDPSDTVGFLLSYSTTQTTCKYSTQSSCFGYQLSQTDGTGTFNYNLAGLSGTKNWYAWACDDQDLCTSYVSDSFYINRQPTASQPSISPSMVYKESVATCVVTGLYSDVDGDAEITTNRQFRWYKNDATIAGQTGATININALDLAKGDTIKCDWRTSDAYSYYSDYSTKSAGKTIQNTAPTSPNNISFVPEIKYVGIPTNATATGSTDADDDEITYYYKFYNVDDSAIKQDWSTSKSYTATTSDNSNTIRVYAKGYDGVLYSSEFYDDYNITNRQPTASQPSISPSIVYKESVATCVVTELYSDVDGDAEITTNRQFRWYKNDATIGGQTGATININALDLAKGDTIKCDWRTSDAYSYYSDYSTKSAGKTIQNTASTVPTDIAVTPLTLYVGSIMNATATGSTDVDDDAPFYHYQFYNVNDSAIRQSWSIIPNYTIISADTRDKIRVQAKVWDGTNWSDEFYEEFMISNSNPNVSIITGISGEILANTSMNITLSIVDVDVESDFDIFIYLNGVLQSTHYAVNSTPTVEVTFLQEYTGTHIPIKFGVRDTAGGIGYVTGYVDIVFGIIEFNFIDEVTGGAFNFSNTNSSYFVLMYSDGDADIYDDITEIVTIRKEAERVLFYLNFGETVDIEMRGRYLNNMVGNNTGDNAVDVYLLDITENRYVFQTISIDTILRDTYVELYSSYEGIISTQKIDISQSSSFILRAGKEYYVRIFNSDGIKEIGTIQPYNSNTITLLLSNYYPQLVNSKENTEWGYMYDGDTLKVSYYDEDGITDSACLRLYSGITLVYNSCIYSQNNITFSYLSAGNQTLNVVLTINKNDRTWTVTRVVNPNDPITTPIDIPSNFLKFFSIFVLVGLSGLATVLSAKYMTIAVIAFASLFTVFGWINIPSAFLFILGAGAILLIMKGGKE